MDEVRWNFLIISNSGGLFLVRGEKEYNFMKFRSVIFSHNTYLCYRATCSQILTQLSPPWLFTMGRTSKHFRDLQEGGARERACSAKEEVNRKNGYHYHHFVIVFPKIPSERLSHSILKSNIPHIVNSFWLYSGLFVLLSRERRLCTFLLTQYADTIRVSRALLPSRRSCNYATIWSRGLLSLSWSWSSDS
jgi:hypothetical protein